MTDKQINRIQGSFIGKMLYKFFPKLKDNISWLVGNMAVDAGKDIVKAEELARIDALTLLPNRRALFEFLENELAVLQRDEDRMSAIIFFDLDNFRAVNDLLGAHIIGDKVLVEVAERLESQTRTADMVARYGGDEFVMVVTDLKDEDENGVKEELQDIFKRVKEAIEAIEIFDINNEVTEVRVSATAGAIVLPGDYKDNINRKISDDLKDLVNVMIGSADDFLMRQKEIEKGILNII